MQLFISQAYLNKKSIIPDNIDWTLIEPILELTQTMDILPLLGSNYYDELITQSTNNTLTTVNKTALDDYILPCMVQYFLMRVTPALKYRYTNKSVSEKSSDNSTPISTDDMKYLIDLHKLNAEELAQRFIVHVRINGTLFPTYFQVSITTLIFPRQNGYDSPLYLEDGKAGLSPYPSWGDIRPT